MYEKILNDNYILNLYNKISIYEENEKGWAHHNLQHAINVAEMIELILMGLFYNKVFIENAKIAALLHDIGCINGKENHPAKSELMAKEYFKKKNIKLKYEKEVLSAIKNHSAGFDENNLMTICLIFCDKIDIKKTRVAKEGYNVVGMRQLQYIDDINIFINQDIIKIDFIINDLLNLKELEDFYFTDKVFKAINSFANKINKKPIININNQKWNYNQ
ncbi:MAG: HD domain-containing protein [Bacilli bacterium]|nr:HD domain-containing protein [Bacilli bacterium]